MIVFSWSEQSLKLKKVLTFRESIRQTSPRPDVRGVDDVTLFDVTLTHCVVRHTLL